MFKFFQSQNRIQRQLLTGTCLMVGVMAGINLQIRAVDAAPALETRCGWFSNPTPANALLYDKDAEWIVGVQGGHQAKGDWPGEFKDSQWVKTNGHYGYGCACMSMHVDKKSHYVLEIKSASVRPLSACRQDQALKKKWKSAFR